MIEVTLTELEKQKIEQFRNDEDMYHAVRKVILAGLYTSGTTEQLHPEQNMAFALASLSITNPIPDEQIGQNVRALWAGINYLLEAFNTIDSIISAKPETKDVTTNPAE